MKLSLPVAAFLLTQLLVLAFILCTVGELPNTVASHFDGTGRPNGFMTKSFYLGFMLIIGLGVPSLIAGGMASVCTFPDNRISLPNKHIWLSERHRASTFAWLRGHGMGMGILTTVFMAYVHWLVILANRVAPAQLSSTGIITGLVVFVIALIVWGSLLPLKFLRLPKNTL